MLHQVRLNGRVPVEGRAPNIGEAIQGIDPVEHNRFHLRHDPSFALVQPVPRRLAEPPFHCGVNGGTLFLDHGLYTRIELIHAAFDRHREEGQDFAQLQRIQGMQVARMRRHQVERPNQCVLVVERGHHHIPHPTLDELLFNRRATRIGGQVLNDQQLTLLDRTLVYGVAKVVDAILRRIGAQSPIRDVGPRMEHQDLAILQRGQPKEQIRLFEERAQFVL